MGDKYIKMKKIILFLLFLIVLSSFTFAEPINNPHFQTLETVDGLFIKYPILDTVKLGDNVTLHFHIFNQSNGYAYRDGDDINCTLHVYDQYSHIFIGWSNTWHDIFDIEFEINNTVLNYVGDYSYIIYCENDYQGGMDSIEFRVTKNGFDDDKTVFLTLIFAVLGFCFVLLYIAFNLEKIHIFFKVIILFTVIFIQIYLGSVVINLVFQTIYEPIGLVFYNAILWFIRLFVVYIFIYLIYSIFSYFEKIPNIKGWKRGK